MKITIDMIDADLPRVSAAVGELRRIKTICEEGYYKRLQAGTMERADANAKLEAMATALLICASAEDALILAERMTAAPDLLAALAPKPLPYDPGESVASAPPVCRLCLHPGEGDGHGSWRCTRTGCLGHTAFVARKLFEGGVA